VPELAPTELSGAGLARAAALLCEVFPAAPPVTPDYLRWAYAENPMGPAVAFDAREAGELVAHLAGRALVAVLEGREQRGLLVHHAATRASQRGKGLFGALVEAIAEAGCARGCDFLIAVANAQSAPLFVARHAFQALGPLDVWLGLGLPPAPVAGARSGFEPLWSEAALAWRLARPGSDYRVRRTGELAQVVAPAGRLGAWVELGWLPARTLPPSLRALGPGPKLGASIGLGARRRARAWPALPVPRRARPSPLELVYRDLRGRERLDRSSCAFRALDFDAW